jgi:hypothetical protein
MKRQIFLTIMFLLIINLKSYAIEFDFSNFRIPNGEQLTLQSKDTVKGTSNKWINTVTDTIENNLPIYLIENGDNTIIKIRKKDLTPISFHQMDKKGNTKKRIEYNGNKARIIIPQQDIDKTIDIKLNTYHSWTFFYLFRALLFNNVNKGVNFSIIKETSDHDFRVINMVAKVVGEEKIVVPAGTYSCYKVELGLSGVIKLFWPNKYYYYFTKDEPHYFVKYVDPEGECMELLKYEIIKKKNEDKK